MKFGKNILEEQFGKKIVKKSCKKIFEKKM